jgi:hypothetical protein
MFLGSRARVPILDMLIELSRDGRYSGELDTREEMAAILITVSTSIQYFQRKGYIRFLRTSLNPHLWSWVLLQKPRILQLLKNFPKFYGTWWFITVFTRALHWFLSWATSIQSIPFHSISLRSILILPTHLRLGLPSGLFPFGFHTSILCAFLFSSNRTCPAHLILLDLMILIILG